MFPVLMSPSQIWGVLLCHKEGMNSQLLNLVTDSMCRGQEGHPKRLQPRHPLQRPLWQGVLGNCAAAGPLQN